MHHTVTLKRCKTLTGWYFTPTPDSAVANAAGPGSLVQDLLCRLVQRAAPADTCTWSKSARKNHVRFRTFKVPAPAGLVRLLPVSVEFRWLCVLHRGLPIPPKHQCARQPVLQITALNASYAPGYSTPLPGLAIRVHHFFHTDYYSALARSGVQANNLQVAAPPLLLDHRG
jgi:hypothetical protein